MTSYGCLIASLSIITAFVHNTPLQYLLLGLNDDAIMNNASIGPPYTHKLFVSLNLRLEHGVAASSVANQYGGRFRFSYKIHFSSQVTMRFRIPLFECLFNKLKQASKRFLLSLLSTYGSHFPSFLSFQSEVN